MPQRGDLRFDGVALRRAMQHQPRRERADDHCRAADRRQPGQQKRERQRDEPERPGRLNLRDDVEDRRHEHAADDECGDDEADGDRRGRSDAEERHAFAGGEPGHHGQDDQSHDVIEHRRAEHDLPLRRVELPEVGEHARRDADRRCRERRAGDDGRNHPEPERVSDEIARHEGQDDAHHSHHDGRLSDAHERAQIGVQADLEEQHENPDLGERVHHGVARIEDAEQRRAEQHAGQELTEHRWLIQPLRHLAEQLRREDGRDEHRQKMLERVHFGHGTIPPETRDSALGARRRDAEWPSAESRVSMGITATPLRPRGRCTPRAPRRSPR